MRKDPLPRLPATYCGMIFQWQHQGMDAIRVQSLQERHLGLIHSGLTIPLVPIAHQSKLAVRVIKSDVQGLCQVSRKGDWRESGTVWKIHGRQSFFTRHVFMDRRP